MSYNYQVTPTSPRLNDDCCFCLDALKNKVESDGRSFRLIANTECNHLFHDSCFSEFLAHENNPNCPMCRAPIAKNRVTKINLDWVEPQVQPRVQPAVQAPVQAPAQPYRPVITHADYIDAYDSQDSDDVVPAPGSMMYDAAKATVGLGASVLSGLGAIALGTLTLGGALAVGIVQAGADGIAKANADLKKAEGTKVASIYNHWNTISKDNERSMKTINEKIAVLLSTINSMPASSTYATHSSAERTERNIQIYKDKRDELDNNFNKLLDAEKSYISSL